MPACIFMSMEPAKHRIKVFRRKTPLSENIRRKKGAAADYYNGISDIQVYTCLRQMFRTERILSVSCGQMSGRQGEHRIRKFLRKILQQPPVFMR